MKKQLMLLILVISLGSLYAQTQQRDKLHPNYYQQGEWILSVSPNIGWAKLAEVNGTVAAEGECQCRVILYTGARTYVTRASIYTTRRCSHYEL